MSDHQVDSICHAAMWCAFWISMGGGLIKIVSVGRDK